MRLFKGLTPDVEHFVLEAKGATILFHRRKTPDGYAYWCPQCGQSLEVDGGCMGDTAVCRSCRTDFGQLPGFPP